jgi:hypothetical protein
MPVLSLTVSQCKSLLQLLLLAELLLLAQLLLLGNARQLLTITVLHI